MELIIDMDKLPVLDSQVTFDDFIEQDEKQDEMYLVGDKVFEIEAKNDFKIEKMQDKLDDILRNAVQETEEKVVEIVPVEEKVVEIIPAEEKVNKKKSKKDVVKEEKKKNKKKTLEDTIADEKTEKKKTKKTLEDIIVEEKTEEKKIKKASKKVDEKKKEKKKVVK